MLKQKGAPKLKRKKRAEAEKGVDQKTKKKKKRRRKEEGVLN